MNCLNCCRPKHAFIRFFALFTNLQRQHTWIVAGVQKRTCLLCVNRPSYYMCPILCWKLHCLEAISPFLVFASLKSSLTFSSRSGLHTTSTAVIAKALAALRVNTWAFSAPVTEEWVEEEHKVLSKSLTWTKTVMAELLWNYSLSWQTTSAPNKHVPPYPPLRCIP